jgi:hypothetical protein
MNPVQLNKKENEPSSTCHRPNVLAQYHSGTACQIRYYNYCHNKQPPAEEAKAIMAGMCPRAPGPRDLLPIFSEFSPSARLPFPPPAPLYLATLRSALSMQPTSFPHAHCRSPPSRVWRGRAAVDPARFVAHSSCSGSGGWASGDRAPSAEPVTR